MNQEEKVPNVLRSYKDNLFRMVFKEKKELLSLYNAVNGTTYSNVDDLTVNTLENAIYMNVKNDNSFLFGSRMHIYEQQSTYCANMPLRDLMYVSRLYEKELNGASIYTTKQIKIPAPKFIVFYNGMKTAPERQIMKLSEAYITEEKEPELELKVTMLNINSEKNKELLDKCKTLKDYVTYVEKVREYAKTMPSQAAVELAVQECIQDSILSEFLEKYRAEAVAMTIYEYDQEAHMRLIAEEAKEEVREEANKRIKEANSKVKKLEKEKAELERQLAEFKRKNKNFP